MLGVVLSVSEGEPDFPVEKLRPLGAVVDDGACLPAELLGFLAPIGEVVRMALPAFERLRARELAEQGLAEGVRFKSTGRVVQTARWKGPPDADLSALTGQTRAVAERLAASGGANLAELARDWSQARAAVRRATTVGGGGATFTGLAVLALAAVARASVRTFVEKHFSSASSTRCSISSAFTRITSDTSETMSALARSNIRFSRNDRLLDRLRNVRLFSTSAMS